MRGIVGPTIRRQQESRDSRVAGVVVRRDEVFEKMEEAQGGDEERHAPEGRWDDAEQEGEAKAQAEGCAEEEGAQGDSRE